MTQLLISNNDDRQYKILYLENGLKCMLVSDMKTKKSAAALRVNVGSHAESICGLPHFLEHMLFYGSKKYPQENYYSEYITQHGGKTNAFTASDNTTYYFTICAEFFNHAVDIFSHFFIDPTFNEEMLGREINAIDSEFYRTYNDDLYKLWQIFYDIIDSDYQITRFSCGNKQTLNNPDLYKMMTEFYNNYYCANIMNLVLIAPETLEYLENLAVECFSNIKTGICNPEKQINKVLPYDNFLNNYKQNDMPYIQLIPNNHANSLNIIWQLQKTEYTHEQKISNFWSNIIGHEGPKSLLSYLKSQSLVLTLSSGCYNYCNFDLFVVKMSLTEYGNSQVNNIVKIIMEYITKLSFQNDETLIDSYEENRKIGLINFHNKSREKPGKYMLELLENMHNYKDPYVLFADNYYVLPTLELCKQLRGFILSMKNMRPIIVHHNINVKEFNNIEQYYNTKYLLTTLCVDNINTSYAQYFDFPQKNIFIPENFDLIDKFPENHERIVLTKNGELWYRGNIEFNVPKVEISFQLILPDIWKSKTKNVICSVYVGILQELINEKLYAASLTGINYSISLTPNCGISFNIDGYSDKLLVVCMTIIEEFAGLQCEERIFKLVVEKLRIKAKKYESYNTQQQLYYHLHEHLISNILNYTDILDILDRLTLNSIEEIKNDFRNHYWVGIIEGNYNIEQSTKLFYAFSTSINKWIQFTGPCNYLNYEKINDIPNNKQFNYVPYNQKEIDTNSSTMKIYVLGNFNVDYKNQLLLNIFKKMIGDSFFDQLRTQQQLGYCVGCNETNCGLFNEDVHVFYFTIQSSEYNNEYLQLQINKYIDNILLNINENSFIEILSSVITELKQPHNSLAQSFSDFKMLVMNNTYDFCHKAKKIQIAEKLSFNDLCEFVKAFIIDNDNNFIINVN